MVARIFSTSCPAASTSSASRLKSAASVRNAAMIESMSAEAIFSGKLVIDRSALCCCLNSRSVSWLLKRQTWSRLTEIPGKEEIDPYEADRDLGGPRSHPYPRRRNWRNCTGCLHPHELRDQRAATPAQGATATEGATLTRSKQARVAPTT